MRIAIHTLCCDNVAPSVLAAHQSVTEHFTLPMRYYRENTYHGAWMDRVIAAADEDVVGFFDVDAVPTNAEIVTTAAEYAVTRRTFIGNAQTSNHLDRWHVFAAPSFFFISRAAWLTMQRPSFQDTHNCDVAQNISRTAERFGLDYRCLYPTHWERPTTEGVWKLSNYGHFAVGTHYHGGVYHLYQSRFNLNVALFVTRCAEITNGTFTTDGMHSTFDAGA
jgi:hypothetical protein